MDKHMIPNEVQHEEEKEKIMSFVNELSSIPYEQVCIKSIDGIELSARYYHVCDNAPIHIQMHGYRANGIRDLCGVNKILREAGQNTLLVDQRAHGRSGGHTITFGVMESQDCLSWAEYMIDRFGKETSIFLSGLSMGASTVLQAAKLDLPPNVVGIIADCPFISAEAIICKVCKRMKLPPKAVFPILRLGGKVFGKFDIKDANVVAAVAHAKIPLLIIHGEADDFVPCEMSQELLAANKELVTLETFPQAGHGFSHIVDTDRYTRVVKTFIDGCLSSVI